MLVLSLFFMHSFNKLFATTQAIMAGENCRIPEACGHMMYYQYRLGDELYNCMVSSLDMYHEAIYVYIRHEWWNLMKLALFGASGKELRLDYECLLSQRSHYLPLYRTTPLSG